MRGDQRLHRGRQYAERRYHHRHDTQMRTLQGTNVASDIDDLIHRSQRPFRLAKERPAFLGGHKPLSLACK